MQSCFGMTIAMDPADLPELRKVILKFLGESQKLLNYKKVKRSVVFRINIGAFPISK